MMEKIQGAYIARADGSALIYLVKSKTIVHAKSCKGRYTEHGFMLKNLKPAHSLQHL
jgi:hypothetical protein